MIRPTRAHVLRQWEAGSVWREIAVRGIIAQAGVSAAVIDHPAARRRSRILWSRTDQAAAVHVRPALVSRAEQQPLLIAAPVPSPAEFTAHALLE